MWIKASLFAATSLALFWPEQASAACWQLPNLTFVETSSRSTPPTRKARRVSCREMRAADTQVPQARRQDQPAEPIGIREWGRQRDDRECVIFARSQVSSLPYGLFSYQDKLDIINDRRPRVGSVAIIRVRRGSNAQYGHVAVVVGVTDTSITLSEANWKQGYRQYRRATGESLRDAERQLDIVGYFRP